MMHPIWIRLLIGILLILVGCSPNSSDFPDEAVLATQFELKETATPEITNTAVPLHVTSTPIITETAAPVRSPATVWISPAVPERLQLQLRFGIDLTPSIDADVSDLQLVVLPDWETDPLVQSDWLYSLVAPFPTLLDEVSLDDLMAAWRGEPTPILAERPLFVEESTRLAFQTNWGPAGPNVIEVAPGSKILEMAWEQQPSLALVPFEELDPQWKIVRVDGTSLLDPDIDLKTYPLTLRFGLHGFSPDLALAPILQSTPAFLPETNFNPERLTVVAMTGVTALARSTALRMEEEGILYPATDIGELLQAADLTHISNEVPFFDGCPPAKPLRAGMRFCSDPEYIELLQAVGADVIELTGNHLMDWGSDGMYFTLKLYQENNLSYYGGGFDLDDARKPLLLEHNGNRIAFMGCNAIGPEAVFATTASPGASPCDIEWMETTIRKLRDQGYLPIVTFQSIEVDDVLPHSMQRSDFGKMADAGAVIVSGSQAHIPQAMTFREGRFIHYGLGNLFFDQMESWQRPQFIDLHTFYDGHYINTELVTTLLEDSARPRLMTLAEREELLIRIFEASGW
jgi:hypothetical protein